MQEMILLFIREILSDISSRPRLEDEPTLMGAITTPIGKLAGIRQSQLEILQIPYISENGRVGLAAMKRLYLEQVLNNLATDLRLDIGTLLDGNREIVIVAEIDTSSDEDCFPCYYGTTMNPVNMENLRRLDANVGRCLSDKLESLPSDILDKWLNAVLIPVFAQAKVIISQKDS